MAIEDYSTNPDANTTINGINIAEGCMPDGINNAIRQLMADIKARDNQLAARIAPRASARVSSGGSLASGDNIASVDLVSTGNYYVSFLTSPPNTSYYIGFGGGGTTTGTLDIGWAEKSAAGFRVYVKTNGALANRAFDVNVFW